ncbi:MAG: zf-HC2 domain-containing protein [Bryobacteraceae bacterium]|nr:zf-HC2 domain-containing protein [Bryobacteraceae bacterium]
MNCAELEALLCDYVDDTLDLAQRRTMEEHFGECSSCAEMARDAAAAVAFIGRSANAEPPQELVTRIIYYNRPTAAVTERKGWRKWFGGWLEPVLQPRFAMGMAMTILSFSMLGRFAGIPSRQLTAADLAPAKVWAAVEDRAHDTWERAVKYYESLRVVYEIQTRLTEWRQQEEEERKNQGGQPLLDGSKKNAPDGGAAASPGDPVGRPGEDGAGGKR